MCDPSREYSNQVDPASILICERNKTSSDCTKSLLDERSECRCVSSKSLRHFETKSFQPAKLQTTQLVSSTYFNLLLMFYNKIKDYNITAFWARNVFGSFTERTQPRPQTPRVFSAFKMAEPAKRPHCHFESGEGPRAEVETGARLTAATSPPYL